ncbi:MAG: HIT domain-containing protein [Nanoarchaeota archaeon]|nr:HIT domain-containing protein [Nanoarchaeota archaeon]
MTLPLEQTEQIKQQIIQQIENTFPEDKKESAIQQIEEMNDSELENFLAQNNLIKNSGPNGVYPRYDSGEPSSGENDEEKCIFCSIVSEKIPGYKIAENDSALAVLEIAPVSKGHTLVIPKVHVQEISKETQDFAKELSIKLKEKLNAKEMQTEESEMFGHKILNIIPIYDDKNLERKKKPASKEVLENLQKELKIKNLETKKEEEKEPEKIEEPITEKNTWLPRRIP